MSQFLTRCIVEYDEQDDGTKTLVSALIYQSDIANGIFAVPKGFRTDGASVPRIVPLAYALFGNTSDEAAFLHDYLYTTQPVTRAVADAVLREASESIGVPAWRRWSMWAAVRLFGGGKDHWKQKEATTQ